MKWYKVIVLAIDIFESVVEDERHFSSKHEVDCYINDLHDNQIGIVVLMNE